MAESKILIVDDDIDFQEALKLNFDQVKGMSISQALTADNALDLLKKNHFDLILLDVQLPGLNGMDALVKLRSEQSTIPVIMLTGLSDHNSEIQGINSGANDYIVKPFEFSVLLARIHAQLRAYATSDAAVAEIGSLVFRPGEKLLSSRDGKVARLTEKEVAILKVLHNAGGAKVDRSELLKKVWGYGPDISTHTLVTHVHRLRKKVEEIFGQAHFLITVDGGYKLVD